MKIQCVVSMKQWSGAKLSLLLIFSIMNVFYFRFNEVDFLPTGYYVVPFWSLINSRFAPWQAPPKRTVHVTVRSCMVNLKLKKGLFHIEFKKCFKSYKWFDWLQKQAWS